MPPKRAKRLVVSPSQEERILNVNAFLQMFEDKAKICFARSSY